MGAYTYPGSSYHPDFAGSLSPDEARWNQLSTEEQENIIYGSPRTRARLKDIEYLYRTATTPSKPCQVISPSKPCQVISPTLTQSKVPGPTQSKVPGPFDVKTGTETINGITYDVYTSSSGQTFLGGVTSRFSGVGIGTYKVQSGVYTSPEGDKMSMPLEKVPHGTKVIKPSDKLQLGAAVVSAYVPKTAAEIAETKKYEKLLEPSKLGKVWETTKGYVTTLAESLPYVSLETKYGTGYGMARPPVLIEVKGKLPYEQKGTIIQRPPTTEELKKMEFYEVAGEREISYEQMLVQNKLDITARGVSEDIASSVRVEGQTKIDSKFNELQNAVSSGAKSQAQAQKEMDTYINTINSQMSSKLDTQFNSRMKPSIDAAGVYSEATSKRVLTEMKGNIDKRQIGLKVTGGFITGVGYRAVGVLAPPVGLGLTGLSLSGAVIKRKEVLEYAKEQPISFGANIAGFIAGGIVGAKVTGAVKTAYMENKFANAAKNAKIQVIGIEKDFSGKFVQVIVGKTKILGKDYIIRINAAGVQTTEGALVASKGYVLRIGESGKLEAITSYQSIGKGIAAGEAAAVKVGKVFNLKRLIGQGFISQGVARTIYHVELQPTAIFPTGELILGKGKIYPGAKFEPTPEMAGAYRGYGEAGNIIKFLMGEKKPSYVYTKTDYGWIYAPEKAKFQPRIKGWLFKLTGEEAGAGETIISAGKKLKLEVFTKQVSIVPDMLIGAGKAGVKAKVAPSITAGFITSGAGVVRLAQQQKNIQKVLSSVLLTKGAAVKTKEKVKVIAGYKLTAAERIDTRVSQVFGLAPVQAFGLTQVQAVGLKQSQIQKQQQKQYSAQIQKMISISPPFYPKPFIPPYIIPPQFPRLPTYQQPKRKQLTYEKQMAKQRRAYAASVAAVSLGIFAPEKRIPKKLTGFEIRPLIKEKEYPAMNFAKQINKILG